MRNNTRKQIKALNLGYGYLAYVYHYTQGRTPVSERLDTQFLFGLNDSLGMLRHKHTRYCLCDILPMFDEVFP